MYNLVEVTHRFQAINTEVETIICLPEREQQTGRRILERAELMFRIIENTLNRFSPDSELSTLNDSAGFPVKANSLLFDAVTAALKAARQTRGAYDPVAADFDNRSIKYAQGMRWQDINLDPAASTINLMPGCRLNLDDISKSWAIDQVSEILSYSAGYAIDAGGEPWNIGIVDPRQTNRNIQTLELKSGAICTSVPRLHLWCNSAADRSAQIISATVLAASAVQAKTLSKAAITLGHRKGLDLLEKLSGVSGLLVLEDGQLLISHAFPEPVKAA